jgi:hypothetical protein
VTYCSLSLLVYLQCLESPVLPILTAPMEDSPWGVDDHCNGIMICHYTHEQLRAADWRTDNHMPRAELLHKFFQGLQL